MDENCLQIMNIMKYEHLELELELKDNPDMVPDIEQALSELSKKEKLLCKVILIIYLILPTIYLYII